MQTIETRYVGATNYRGSRMIATASGAEARVTLSYDSGASDEDMHATAAKALCAKLNWSGKMVGGHSKNGMIWVFDEELSPRFEAVAEVVAA